MTAGSGLREQDYAVPGIIGWILLLWAVANFGPHLVVYLLSGQPYFALPLYIGIPIEVGLMALNLGLPVRWLRQRGTRWREGLAWRWQGRRTWLWGLGGLAISLMWSWVVTLLIPVPGAGSTEGRAYPFPQVLLVFAGLLILWAVTVIGEEGMFRGWMQTQLEARGRTGLSIVLPALLFGLRHLPLDLYEGHAGFAGWAARLVELYGLALLIGLVRWRTRSVASTAILHGVVWWLVIFGLYNAAIGAAIGAGNSHFLRHSSGRAGGCASQRRLEPVVEPRPLPSPGDEVGLQQTAPQAIPRRRKHPEAR